MITERFSAQLLTGEPARSAEAVTGRLLAVQAQDPRGARLAIRVRSAGLTAADVDRALTADRSLLITWLNRGTLHLVRAEDYWWLQPLLAPRLATANARRLAQEGVTPAAADKAVAVIEKSLAAEGPLTRPQLRDRIAAAGVRTEGQALVHELLLACLRSVAVRGPMAGAQHAYVLVRDWLGAPPPFDRDAALAELARRFLAGHGPASDRDLAKWAGLPVGDARRGLAAIAGQLAPPADGLVDLAGRAGGRRGTGVPPPRLLGSFDPVLHGWVSREPILGPHRGIVTVNGLFRPFALVDGRAVATWGLAGGAVTMDWLQDVPGPARAALAADEADVRRFLGLP
ncbi:MAG TPA: winged helix DNA-binding domain-containing protein [Streptosporangiaceae bacterium]|nr:winged helix DNA-binding domain-containing protein [Streptosporangiaceae bacterium]